MKRAKQKRVIMKELQEILDTYGKVKFGKANLDNGYDPVYVDSLGELIGYVEKIDNEEVSVGVYNMSKESMSRVYTYKTTYEELSRESLIDLLNTSKKVIKLSEKEG